MKISVLGAGAWGTALAVQACERHAVRLWARDAQQVAQMRSLRRNARYLKERVLPAALQVGGDLPATLAHAASDPAGGLVVIATPMAGLHDMLVACREHLPPGVPVVWLCKGLQQGSGLMPHEVAQAVLPGGAVGVLSGPSFALEVARGQPTALVAASERPEVGERAVEAFHGDGLRIYTSADVAGVEVGGAVKNVLAIATGIADGMNLGLNARAALITRGLAEMTRLGVALGAQPDTFMGLSGLGDLVLTATGSLSRNRTVGLKLAEGLPLAQILTELGHVAEGVYSAATVLQRAKALDVAMPITEAVVAVLEGRITPAKAVGALMSREAKAESAKARTQTPFE